MNDLLYVPPIDNSRILKPVDFRISLRLGSWLLIFFLLAGALLFKAWVSIQIRQMGYQIETARSEVDSIQQENHLLRVERAALRSPERIDTIARGMLGMTLPSQQQMIILDSTHLSGDQPVMAQVRVGVTPEPTKHRLPE